MRRFRSPEPARVQPLKPDARILVVKLATAGDALLTTPALRALRRRYPSARIDLLTTETGAALLAHSPLLDSCLVLDKYAFDSPIGALLRPHRLAALVPFLLRLRRTRYDAVVLLHHLTLRFGRLKYRALLLAMGAPARVGLDNGHGDFLNVRVDDDGFGARHEAEYALDVAAALDARPDHDEQCVTLTDLGWPVSEARATPLPRDVPPRIALHPGSGSYSTARRWPAPHFTTLAGELHARLGAEVVLVGGQDETALHEHILAQLEHPGWARSAAGSTTPRELAGILRSCALFIGNDSFPMHLAVALGVPVVAVFGPSNADAWGPFTPGHPERAVIVRRTDLACSPCIYRGHSLGMPQGCPPRPCLTELTPRTVLAAALRLLRTLPADGGRAG